MDIHEQLARALQHLAVLEHDHREIAASVEVLIETLEAPGRDGQKVDAVLAELRQVRARMGRG